jgi:hypothetical protein
MIRALVLILVALVPLGSVAQDRDSSVEDRLRRLEQRQESMENELRAKDARIRELEERLKQTDTAGAGRAENAEQAKAPTDDKAGSAKNRVRLRTAKKEDVTLPGSTAAAETDTEPQYYGVFAPGKGFSLARTKYGDINASTYFLVRYLNHDPNADTWTDHFGNEREFSPSPRNDFQVNRMMLMFFGWIYDPRFRYFTYVWTSNAQAGRETQVLIGGNVSYKFSKAFTLFAGIGPMQGTRTNQNVWPYFMATDRRMADEFFRPAYTQGLWIAGNPLPKFYYQAMVGNNLSLLGIDAGQLDRNFSYGAAVWWMPTTGEFGPRGSLTDYEIHDKLATRVGLGFTWSPEDRQSQPDPLSGSENTVIRLSDGLVAFDEGALAPGVTVNELNYTLLAANAGLKYQGFSLNGEYFFRWLDHFKADGPLPVDSIFDHGFQVQTSYQVWPKRVEAYTGTSWVFGNFRTSWEAVGGFNVFPFDTRNFRLNGELIYVDKAPAGSLYTPYLVGQTGLTFVGNIELFF